MFVSIHNKYESDFGLISGSLGIFNEMDRSKGSKNQYGGSRCDIYVQNHYF